MNAWDGLLWRWKWRKYPAHTRPRCLDCRKPLKEYGKLCEECKNRPDNFLPPVPETKSDFGAVVRAESEYSDGPDCDIRSHYWECSTCGARTHLGFAHGH